MNVSNLLMACSQGPVLDSTFTLEWDNTLSICKKTTMYTSSGKSSNIKTSTVNAADCCMKGIETMNTQLSLACAFVTAEVTFTYAGIPPKCKKSTVITMDTISKAAIVEDVSDEYCCTKGMDESNLMLMMACPEVTSAVTYNFAGSTCTQSTIVTVGTDPKPAHLETVNTNICCAVGRNPPTSLAISASNLVKACELGPTLDSVSNYEYDNINSICTESTVFRSDMVD